VVPLGVTTTNRQADIIMSTPTSEILTRAADLITEKGWHQGDWMSPTGAMTIEAAIWHSTWGTYQMRKQLMARAHQEACRRMRMRFDQEQRLDQWNNAWHTNMGAVLDLLRDKPIPPNTEEGR